jgi:hypothetical protein
MRTVECRWKRAITREAVSGPMPKKERRAAERRRRSGKLREKRKTWGCG